MNDLLKKLQDLGLKIEKASKVELITRPKDKISEIIQGEWFESHGQSIFAARKLYPYGEKHGRIEIEINESFNEFADFWGLENNDRFVQRDFLFLDTETSSLSIGAGSLIFLFGCCYFVKDGLEVLQLFIEDPSHETFFLTYILDLLEHFQCLVSYNGKSFDIPVLRSRFILNKIGHQIDGLAHIDLLHIARRIWKYDLESKKLSDIESAILNFSRNEEEVPGWLVPQIYQDYVQTGNADPIKGVFYHNEIDVVSLAALFLKINKMLMENDLQGKESLSLGEIYQKTGQFGKSDRYFKQALESNVEDDYTEKILMNLGCSLKKQGKWIEALEIWETLAKASNIEACIELAKYFEHKANRIETALDWTIAAKKIFSENNQENSNLREQINKRSKRLEGKLEKRNEKQ